MNGRLLPKLLAALCFFFSYAGYSQYILNGSAQKVSCNCYTLTNEQTFQSGSVWNSNKINLTNSFDFWFNVFLGCKDGNGADGIVFILQPNSTSIGTAGEGMGFDGVRPSIGIALDTWQNFNWNDPWYDHISIQANGNVNHNSDLAGPVAVSASSNNVEDCQWHRLRISWDAATTWLRVYFDGVLRLEKQIDLVSTIFNGDPKVYWGFTGATGGQMNVQQFCTALNPIFTTNFVDNNGCEGASVSFNNASESFAPIVSYNWSFGDGSFSNLEKPLPHTYAVPGKYPVHLKIKGQDGCENDSTISVTINSNPAASFQVFDTCSGFLPRVEFQRNNTGVSYQWSLDGTVFSTTQQPQFSTLNTGSHQLQVVVTSNFACGQPATASGNFNIKPKPSISGSVEDGCVLEPLFFKGEQTDNQTTVSQWNWNFGDGRSASSPNTTHQYSVPDLYSVSLWAQATNGCESDTLFFQSHINQAVVNAGRDTAVIQDLPFQLHGGGNGNLLWSPAGFLSDPTNTEPVVRLSQDQQFILTVTTTEGCVAMDTVLIKTYKGPAVYVPTAFTPNGDGKNEIFRPVYVGIRELKKFAVFNRWGQLIFSTNDMQKGWNGKDWPVETYVWIVQAIDASNQPLTLKGIVTLIR